MRSAVTNGKRLFVEGSGTSAWSRRFADLVAGHVSDLGGPNGMLSEAELSLIRRAAAIECELEALEGRLSRGEPVDLDSFGRGASHLRRLLESLNGGLRRRPRDLIPSPLEYGRMVDRLDEKAWDDADDEADR
jgi:hypothetical protein